MGRQLEEALKVLGIPADSERERVTNAYRRLARVTHPDVSPDPDAAERFAILTAAYRLVCASCGHSRNSERSAALSESCLLRPPPPRSYGAGTPAGDSATASSDRDRSDLLRVVSPDLRAGSRASRPIVAGPVMVRRAQGDVG
jgi:hypothetical protein